MNKYKVGVSRNYYTEFEVIAEDELEAEDKADELFDNLILYGSELYNDYNGKLELIEEDIEDDNYEQYENEKLEEEFLKNME